MPCDQQIHGQRAPLVTRRPPVTLSSVLKRPLCSSTLAFAALSSCAPLVCTSSRGTTPTLAFLASTALGGPGDQQPYLRRAPQAPGRRGSLLPVVCPLTTATVPAPRPLARSRDSLPRRSPRRTTTRPSPSGRRPERTSPPSIEQPRRSTRAAPLFLAAVCRGHSEPSPLSPRQPPRNSDINLSSIREFRLPRPKQLMHLGYWAAGTGGFKQQGIPGGSWCGVRFRPGTLLSSRPKRPIRVRLHPCVFLLPVHLCLTLPASPLHHHITCRPRLHRRASLQLREHAACHDANSRVLAVHRYPSLPCELASTTTSGPSPSTPEDCSVDSPRRTRYPSRDVAAAHWHSASTPPLTRHHLPHSPSPNSLSTTPCLAEPLKTHLHT